MPEWSARYQGRPAMPSLLQLLPIRDASDPLNRFLGNEQLGNSFTHQVGSAYRLQHIKSGRSWNIDANYRRLHNDIAMQSSYDAATAVRTYQPVNTSRTHAVQGSTRFSTPLDAKNASISASFSIPTIIRPKIAPALLDRLPPLVFCATWASRQVLACKPPLVTNSVSMAVGPLLSAMCASQV